MKNLHPHSSSNHIKSFIYFVCFVLVLPLNCTQDEEPYNPCLKNRRIESLFPSQHSWVWLPYPENAELCFANSASEKIIFKRINLHQAAESLKSSFPLICPNDSLQTSLVDYSTFEYQNDFQAISDTFPIAYLHLYIDVILNEKQSTLDKLKLADILKVLVSLKNNNEPMSKLKILQFPIFDRGYKDALSNQYRFFPFIDLNGRLFYNVYSNFENSEQIRMYYSEAGLLAFELEQVLFLRK